MKTFVSYIKKLCNAKEGIEIEFKSAKGGFPGSFWESFSAFANTNGGLIVLGVKQQGQDFIPDGLDEKTAMSFKKRFWDCAHNKTCVSMPLLVDNDVTDVIMDDGSHILIFQIPRAHFSQRPIYLTQNPFGNVFKRNHEGDYRCTDEEVRLMFSDANHSNCPADARILNNFTIENDIDAPSLKAYRNLFDLRQSDHPWSQLDDKQFLERIGGYRIDTSTAEEGLTFAGMLMFGKSERITDSECAPWYFVDYRERMDADPQIRWTDRIIPDGTWEANLFQFFFRVLPRIQQPLPVPFILEGNGRVDETYAHKSVREALVNSIIHAVWNQKGNLVIERTPTMLLFSNPGNMLISIESFYKDGQSECRNPNLQKMFLMMGRGERAGSGAETILKGWRENNWLKPKIKEMVQPDRVELRLQFEHGEDIKKDSWEDGGKDDNNIIDNQINTILQDYVKDAVEDISKDIDKDVMNRIEKWKFDELEQLLDYCMEPHSATEIVSEMQTADRKNLSRYYLMPLCSLGLIKMTVPDKPTSKNQRYFSTAVYRLLKKKHET